MILKNKRNKLYIGLGIFLILPLLVFGSFKAVSALYFDQGYLRSNSRIIGTYGVYYATFQEGLNQQYHGTATTEAYWRNGGGGTVYLRTDEGRFEKTGGQFDPSGRNTKVMSLRANTVYYHYFEGGPAY